MKALKILFLFLFISSCSINGNVQGLVSYYSQTAKESPDLIQRKLPSTDACELRQMENPVVYMVRGMDLRKCMGPNTNALVYIWGPNCKASVCRPLGELQQKCDSNSLEFFVVAEYYDARQMKLPHAIEKPVFGVDVKYYRSNFTHKYLDRFMEHFLDEQRDFKGRYLFFENGNYRTSFASMDDLLLKQ